MKYSIAIVIIPRYQVLEIVVTFAFAEKSSIWVVIQDYKTFPTQL